LLFLECGIKQFIRKIRHIRDVRKWPVVIGDISNLVQRWRAWLAAPMAPSPGAVASYSLASESCSSAYQLAARQLCPGSAVYQGTPRERLQPDQFQPDRLQPDRAVRSCGKLGRSRVYLIASTDVLTHGPVLQQARAHGRCVPASDFRPMFPDIRPLVAEVELALCHLKVPLSCDGHNILSWPPRQAASREPIQHPVSVAVTELTV
jgi:hypothetical protein